MRTVHRPQAAQLGMLGGSASASSSNQESVSCELCVLASGISTARSVSWDHPWTRVCFCTILLKIRHKWSFIVKYFHSNKDGKLKIIDLCYQFEKLAGRKKSELNVVQVEGKLIIEQTSIELENRKKINREH